MSTHDPDARRVRWEQVAAFRLMRHGLAGRAAKDVVTIAREICGVQAQIMTSAEIALWARGHDLARARVAEALWQERTLVKTAAMRQTLHLVPADEFLLYITALRRSRMEAVLRVMARVGVTPREADALTGWIVDALAGGPLSQGEIRGRVTPHASAKMRKWMGKVWSMMRTAIAEGLVCHGPMRGAEATYIRVDQWLPKQKQMSEDEAKQELIRRFLGAYGPATARDFAKWSGISMQEAGPVWESLGDEFAGVSIEGGNVFLLRRDERALRDSPSGPANVRLLPAFDPYLLAHADKAHLVEASCYKRVYRNQGWISAVVLLNGKIIGTWDHERRGRQLVLEIHPFEKLAAKLKPGIEAEAKSLAQFFDLTPQLRFGK